MTRPRPVVVVGVDADPVSLDALRTAASEAELRGCTVLAVHCWQVPWRPHEELLDDAVALVHAERVRAGATPVPVQTRLVEDDGADALWTLARGATLLVLGARHHARLLGSTTSLLTGDPPCPVLVVPASTGTR